MCGPIWVWRLRQALDFWRRDIANPGMGGAISPLCARRPAHFHVNPGPLNRIAAMIVFSFHKEDGCETRHKRRVALWRAAATAALDRLWRCRGLSARLCPVHRLRPLTFLYGVKEKEGAAGVSIAASPEKPKDPAMFGDASMSGWVGALSMETVFCALRTLSASPPRWLWRSCEGAHRQPKKDRNAGKTRMAHSTARIAAMRASLPASRSERPARGSSFPRRLGGEG